MNNLNEIFSQIFSQVQNYLQYPYVRYALVLGVLISIATSLFGASLILKRLTFAGNGLTNVAFGATAIATVVGLSDNIVLVFPITVLCAVFLLKRGESNKGNGDSNIALISVVALAVGYLILSVFSPSTDFANNIISIMFGGTSILTLSKTSIIVCGLLSVFMIVLFVVLYNKIFAYTFDEEFLKATSGNTYLYNYILAIAIAVIVTLAMNLVGSLLVMGLVLLPAMSAMRVFKSYRAIVLSSVIVSVICTIVGLLTSIILGTPVGSTIIILNIIAFGIFYLVGLKRV